MNTPQQILSRAQSELEMSLLTLDQDEPMTTEQAIETVAGLVASMACSLYVIAKEAERAL